MKVCIITRSTIKHFKSGGMETHLNNLIAGLTSHGVDITVLTTSFPGEYLEKKDKEIFENGVRYIFIGGTTPGLNPLSLWEKLFVSLGVLNRRVISEGAENFKKKSFEYFLKLNNIVPFDVVLSQSTAADNFISDQFKAKFITVIHGTIRDEVTNRLRSNRSFKNWVRFLLVDIPKWTIEYLTTNRQFFRKVDLIVAVSNTLKQSFLRDYPETSNKVVVIYNGVDESRFTFSPKVDNDILNILNIGRMDREKGVDLILAAVLKLSQKGINNVHLDLVGNGVHLEEFKHFVLQNQINGIVTFHGEVDNSKLPSFYKNADVFILPSRRKEGHPVTISESFCSGLPVISTRNGGLHELFTDNVEGFFVSPNSVDEIVSKLEFLIANPEKLASMKNKALQLGLQRYTRSEMAKKYIELFNS